MGLFRRLWSALTSHSSTVPSKPRLASNPFGPNVTDETSELMVSGAPSGRGHGRVADVPQPHCAVHAAAGEQPVPAESH